MAGGFRIIISSEARNFCHSQEDGPCLESSKRESSYPQTFGHRPIYICGEASADLAFPLGKGVVSRKAVFSYRSLPHWGRGTASAVDRVLSQTAYLRRSPSLSFISLFPSNLRPFGAPPSIGRRERPREPPSLGRGCRAQRGGVGFLFGRRSRLLFAFPLGKGVVSRKAVSSYRSLPHWGRGTA